jgi:hypothetical protein
VKVILLSTVAVVVLAASSCGGDDQTVTENPVKQNVKVVIAGTNDALEEQTEGGIAGEGNFRATGAITDKGTVTAYRGVNEGVILLRFVTKGTEGTITYGLVIDTTVRPVTSRWTIESATKAYKGLRGRGIETENATYTVSTLRGKVWR